MLVSLVRAAILYLLIVLLLRIIGKKQIGQLEPSELVLSLVIADLASAPMSDVGIPLSYGVIPILAVYICEKVLTYFTLHSQKSQAIIEGKPSILVKNGKIDEAALRSCSFTVDDLLEQLRLKNHFELQTVAYAILETSGQLSVVPVQDSNDKSFNYQLPLSLIIDGEICTENLRSRNLEQNWLDRQLERHQMQAKNVFYAYLDKNNQFHLQAKNVTVKQ